MASPPISSLTRHSRDFPCPICGGHAALSKGRGERCAGFSLDSVSYCTREQFAGRALLDITTEPPTYKHYLHGDCHCGIEHGSRPKGSRGPRSQPRQEEHELPLESRHAIFSVAIARLGLRREASENLTRRGLQGEDIECVGYRSIPNYTELNAFLRGLVEEFGETLLRRCPGFVDKNGRTFFWSAGRSQAGYRDGFVVPYRNEDGLITGIQLKRLDGAYETARHSRTAEIYHVAGRITAGSDFYLTEGGLKAEVAHQLGGVTVVGFPGQSLSFRHVEVLVRLKPARLIEALDQESNQGTERARERWQHELCTSGLPTYRSVWEGSDVGGPKGLDDLFAAGGRPRIRVVTLVPPETGEKRLVRQVGVRGAIDAGVPLGEARQRTRSAIDAFVAQAAKRR